MGTSISYQRPDGKENAGYLALGARADAPGIVVIQEWWGVQDQIKGICDRLALAGFDAIAPDLYKGVVVPYHDDDAAGREMASLDFVDATEQNVRGAAQFLQRNGAKVGITGFCLGGVVTVIAAARISEFSAAVPFYGLPPEDVVKPAEVKIPLQGHFALKDTWITAAMVDTFEAAMKTSAKTCQIFRYNADHAFVNEQRASTHDRQAAELAWGRAIAFFNQHLNR
jgi:carboxymethylenebutenolidase